MRKKTINFIIGIIIGLFICSLCLVPFIFYREKKYGEEILNYKNKIDNLENSKKLKIYRFKKDIEKNNLINLDDLESFNISEDLFTNNMIIDENDILKNEYFSSFNIKKGEILTNRLIRSEIKLPMDLRKFEISGILMPVNMKLGDYLDIRISFNTGVDFLVLSKKQVKEILTVGEEEYKEYYIFYLTTEEILRLQSALVDAYLNEGSYLYSVIYVDSDKQENAKVTYPVNEYVREILKNDPNILKEAMDKFDEKFNNNERVILEQSLENQKNTSFNKVDNTRDIIDIKREFIGDNFYE